MNDIHVRLLNSVAETWMEIIWTVSWQFCVLGLIAFVLHLSLYRAAPNWRYWLWQILAIKLLLMPFWTATAPWKWPASGSVPTATAELSVNDNSSRIPSPLSQLPESGNRQSSSSAESSLQQSRTGQAADITLDRSAERNIVSANSASRIRPRSQDRPPGKSATGDVVAVRPKTTQPPLAASAVKQKLAATPQPFTPRPVPNEITDPVNAKASLPGNQAAAPAPAAATKPHLSWQAWLMFAWMGGVVWLAGRIVWLGLSLSRHLRSKTKAEPAVLQRVQAVARQLGLSRIPEVCVVDLEVSPFVCGLWRTRLILPQGLAETFAPEQLDLVILHELAHLRRRDLAWGWIPEAARVFFFFHPMVHFLCYQIRFERELACDQLALQSSGRDVGTYAETLVRVVGQFSCPDSFGLAAAESPPT